MVDEQGNFRRKLMGGFDQEDVISYIEELSFQRNKYQLEAVQRSHEAGDLKAQVEVLRQRAEDKDAELTRTNRELSDCRRELDELRRELREAQDELSVVKNQLDRTNRELTVAELRHENAMKDANDALTGERAKLQAQNRELVNSAAEIVENLQREFESGRSGIKKSADTVSKLFDDIFENASGTSAAFASAKEKLNSLLNND